MKKPVSAWVRVIRDLRGYNKSMSFSSGFFEPFLDHYTQMLDCPDPLAFEDYRLGLSEPAERHKLTVHLEGCERCRQLLEQLTLLPDSLSELSEQLPAAVAQAEPETGLERPKPAPGQIWSSRAVFDLAAAGLPVTDEAVAKASFLRLFVITGLGPRRLGRFQILQLCPITELTELASDRDLMLTEADTTFEEPVMIESWNRLDALAEHLESCLGEISPRALTQLSDMLAGLPGESLRGGQIISPEGPHARFQARDREQVAYLNLPIQALEQLCRYSSRYLLRIEPKTGLSPATGQAPPTPLFPARLQQGPDRVLAASSSDSSLAPAAHWKETLQLSDELLVDVWLEGSNLEFYAYTVEQMPLSGLNISVPDAQGALRELVSDELGTAFISLTEISSGEILLGFKLAEPALVKLLPVSIQN